MSGVAAWAKRNARLQLFSLVLRPAVNERLIWVRGAYHFFRASVDPVTMLARRRTRARARVAG